MIHLPGADSIVLPPIPTTGLTSADVPKLMEDTRTKMLEALREIHYLSIPETPSPSNRTRPSRPTIEQRPSQEQLLPKVPANGSGYGSSIPSTHEEEAVDQFLGDSDRASISTTSNSEIVPQTVESMDDPKGIEGGGGKGGKRRKQKKPLSIA